MLSLMTRSAMDLAASVGPVYPVTREKSPLVRGGYLSATVNYKTIVALWQHRFPEANIGLRLDGLMVIDLDNEDESEKALANLEQEYGKLSETAQVKSSRGRHLYFRVPTGVKIPSSQSILAEGIDIVGTGCGVIAPPSIHKSGHVYRWMNELPFAKLPENWIVRTMYATLFKELFHAA